MEIGAKIKLLRKERKLTLAEVSEKTGIAQSTLSRIEKGIRTGSVQTHLKICQALSVRISELYAGLEKPPEEVAPVDTESTDVEGYSYNEKAFAISLVRELFKKKMKPELLIIAPSSTATEPGDPPGTEKFLFCYEGFIEVGIDNKARHELKKGGTLYFSSSPPHYFKNIGKATAKCLAVSSTTNL